MTGVRATRTEWILFFILGFMWGSSYLFIKIAVDSFGTFTLIALRLLIGAAFLWVAFRLNGTSLPRERRIYGHLVVMALINITIPFGLITWAEQSVDSALAAILNATVPLMVIVIAPMFLPDEPIRLNGVVGLAVGFIGVVLLVSPGLTTATGDLAGSIALLGSSLAYALGNVYNRRNVRGLPPLVPAVFQVTFAFIIVSVLALDPGTAMDREAGPRGLVLGDLARGLRFGAGVRAVLPPAGPMGGDADVVGRLPPAGLRDRAGIPRAPGTDRRDAHRGHRARHRGRRAGQQPVGTAAAVPGAHPGRDGVARPAADLPSRGPPAGSPRPR